MAGFIQVNVIDAKTRAPLGGAKLVIQPAKEVGKPDGAPNVLKAMVPPGSWTVQVTHRGYDAFEQSHIHVSEGHTTELKIALFPAG